jgi:four helix bundle protein
MLDFQKLDVYKCSIEFLRVSLEVIRLLPRGHSAQADQLKRAAESIAQNIAEGAGRYTRADKARHYTIARGSAMECAGTLDILRIEDAIEADRYDRGIELLGRIVSMLTRLIEPR